ERLYQYAVDHGSQELPHVWSIGVLASGLHELAGALCPKAQTLPLPTSVPRTAWAVGSGGWTRSGKPRPRKAAWRAPVRHSRGCLEPAPVLPCRRVAPPRHLAEGQPRDAEVSWTSSTIAAFPASGLRQHRESRHRTR